MPTVNEKIQDKTIRHAHYFERYKTHEVNQIIKSLDKNLFKDLIKKIRRDVSDMGDGKVIITPLARKRLSKLTLVYADMIKDAYKQMGVELHDSMVDTAVSEAEWQLKTYKDALPIDYDFIKPSESRLAALANTTPIRGQFVSSYLKAMPVAASAGINEAITLGWLEGETTNQIVKRVTGSLNIDRNHVRTLVRTATTEMSTVSRETVANRNTDVVKGLKYTATLDGRTTLICINLDGNVYPVNEGPRPPQHFNCRSTMTHVLDGWEEFGVSDPPQSTRASMNGQVPADTTYPEWLKQQPKAFQDEVLGKGSAKLWRSGDVKIDKFVENGKPIPLKELKKMV